MVEPAKHPAAVPRASFAELVRNVFGPRPLSHSSQAAGGNAVERVLEGRAKAESAAGRERSLAEVNLQRLPFAVLTTKKSGSTTPIVVEEAFHRGGEVERRVWRVSPNVEYGLPGPSAYLVFRALEKIVLSRTLARGAPLENPQTFEFQEIARELGLADHSDNREQIRLDLRRIKGASFVNKGMIRRRLVGRPGSRPARARLSEREELVSLIERLAFRNETLSDGTVATENKVWFGSFYMESVNTGYVKPFDWGTWGSLKRPAARRLFEILDLRLSKTPDAEVVDFDYEKLVAVIPLTPQKHLSKAQGVLNRLLDDLQGPVLASYAWREVDGGWVIHLSPSPAYRRRRGAQEPELDLRAQELAQRLGDQANLPFCKKVVGSVDRQYIDIALSETRQAADAGQVKNRGAYFTRALREILKRRGLPVPYGA